MDICPAHRIHAVLAGGCFQEGLSCAAPGKGDAGRGRGVLRDRAGSSTVPKAQASDGPGLGIQIDEGDVTARLGPSGRQVDGGRGFTHSVPMVSKSDNAHLGSLNGETSRHKRVAGDKAPEEPLHLQAAGIKG